MFDALMGGVAMVAVFQFISATGYLKSCMFTFGVGTEALQFVTELNWLTELRILSYSALFLAVAWLMKSICRMKNLTAAHFERKEKLIIYSFLTVSATFALFMFIIGCLMYLNENKSMQRHQEYYKKSVLGNIQKIKIGDSRETVMGILKDTRWEWGKIQWDKINPDAIEINISQIDGIDEKGNSESVIINFKNDSVSEIKKDESMVFY